MDYLNDVKLIWQDKAKAHLEKYSESANGDDHKMAMFAEEICEFQGRWGMVDNDYFLYAMDGWIEGWNKWFEKIIK